MSYDVNSHHLSNLRAMFTIISRAQQVQQNNYGCFRMTAKSTSDEVLGMRSNCDMRLLFSCFAIIWFGLMMDLLDCSSLIS